MSGSLERLRRGASYSMSDIVNAADRREVAPLHRLRRRLSPGRTVGLTRITIKHSVVLDYAAACQSDVT